MEDDYLERARDIWQKYQFYIYIGLAMVLAIITGFTYRHSYYDEIQKAANHQLYELIRHADSQEEEQATAAYEALKQYDEFKEMEYLGAFVLASLYFEKERFQQAVEVLQPVMENSDDSGIKHLAALRVAEIQTDIGDYEQAINLLSEHTPSSGQLQILFAERTGDAHYAAGDVAAAGEAYRRARALASENADFYQPLINIKLGALLSNVDAAAQVKTDSGGANEDDDNDETPAAANPPDDNEDSSN